MLNFHDTFETRKRSFINAFSICITVPLIIKILQDSKNNGVEGMAIQHFRVRLLTKDF